MANNIITKVYLNIKIVVNGVISLSRVSLNSHLTEILILLHWLLSLRH